MVIFFNKKPTPLGTPLYTPYGHPPVQATTPHGHPPVHFLP